MTVTRDDAAAALRNIDTAERRAQTAFGYRSGAPYLLLWGAVWIAAGAVGGLSPGNAGLGWLAADIAGLIGTAYLVATQARRCSADGPWGGARGGTVRFVAMAAILAAFIALTLSLFAPVSGVAVQTFIVLLVAAAYATLGCWFGLLRFAAVGTTLAVLAACAFHLAPAHAALVVPLTGGSALILAGLWMRRAL